MKSYFEQMGGTYRMEGDYYIPNLTLPPASGYQIGKYGRIRRSYLKDHHPFIYSRLSTNGKLFEDLEEVDKRCNERMDHLCTVMAKNEGVTEALKASDQMEWVRRKNNIHSRAEEIILRELISTYEDKPHRIL